MKRESRGRGLCGGDGDEEVLLHGSAVDAEGEGVEHESGHAVVHHAADQVLARGRAPGGGGRGVGVV